jgi:hypothetical protein
MKLNAEVSELLARLLENMGYSVLQNWSLTDDEAREIINKLVVANSWGEREELIELLVKAKFQAEYYDCHLLDYVRDVLGLDTPDERYKRESAAKGCSDQED